MRRPRGDCRRRLLTDLAAAHSLGPRSVARPDHQVLGSPGQNRSTPRGQVVAPAGAQTLVMGFCQRALMRWQVVESAGSTGLLIMFERKKTSWHE